MLFDCFVQYAKEAAISSIICFTSSSLVDADAFDDIETKPKFNELFNNYGDIIKNLSVTTEVKFIQIPTGADDALKAKFRDRIHSEISVIINSNDYRSCNSDNPRTLAKCQFDVFVKKCVATSGGDERIIVRDLIEMIVDTISND